MSTITALKTVLWRGVSRELSEDVQHHSFSNGGYVLHKIPLSGGGHMSRPAMNQGTRTMLEGLTYFRGYNPGDSRRISTGSKDWDDCLFCTDKEEHAKSYGSHIAKVHFSDTARIIREDSPEFHKTIGRWKKGERLLDFGTRAVRKAKELGYDAVHFNLQGSVGTAVINKNAVRLEESRWEPGLPGHVSSKFWGAYRGGKPEPEHLWHHDHGELQVVKKSAKIPGHEEWLGNDYGGGDSFHGRVKGDVGVVNTVYPTDRQRLMAGRVKKDLERAFPHVKTWYVPDKELSVHFQESNMSEAKRLINELSEGHTNEDEYQRLAKYAAENTPPRTKSLGNRSHGAGAGQDLKWEDRLGTNRVSTEHLAETEHGAYRVSPAGFGSWTLQYHPHGGSLITVKRLFSAEDAKRFAQSHHNTRYDAGGKLMREARERWDTDPDPTNEKKRFGATAMFRYVGPHGYSENLHVYQDESGNKQYVDASTGETFKDLGAAMESVKLSSRSNAYHKVQHRKVSEAREIVAELGESGFESSPFRSGTYQDTGTELVYNAGHGRYYYSKSTGRVSYHKAMTAPRSLKTTRGSGVELGMAKNQEHAMRMIRNHQVPIEHRRASGLPEGPGQPKPYQRRLTGLESRDSDAPRSLWVAEEPNGRGSFVTGSTVAQVRAQYAKMGYNPNDIHHIGDYRSPLWVNKKHPLAKYKPGSNAYNEDDDHVRESRDADSRSQGGAAKFLLNDEDWHSGSFQHPDEGPVRAVHRNGRYTIHASAAGYHVRHEETDHGHSGVWGKFYYKPEAVGSPQKSFEDAQLVARAHYLKNYAGGGGAYMGEAREIVEELTEASGLPEGPGQPKPYQRRLTGLESAGNSEEDTHAYLRHMQAKINADTGDDDSGLTLAKKGMNRQQRDAFERGRSSYHSGESNPFDADDYLHHAHNAGYTFEHDRHRANKPYLEARALIAELSEEETIPSDRLVFKDRAEHMSAFVSHGMYELVPHRDGLELFYTPNQSETVSLGKAKNFKIAEYVANAHHSSKLDRLVNEARTLSESGGNRYDQSGIRDGWHFQRLEDGITSYQKRRGGKLWTIEHDEKTGSHSLSYDGREPIHSSKTWMGAVAAFDRFHEPEKKRATPWRGL